MQISDRFHLMHNLKKDAVEPIKVLLGQKRMKQPYPYPSEDEAYRYIMDDILEMGDARHRKKVRTYYEVRCLKDEGKTVRIKTDSIWKYIVTGETESKKQLFH
jgi:hypothetical protein